MYHYEDLSTNIVSNHPIWHKKMEVYRSGNTEEIALPVQKMWELLHLWEVRKVQYGQRWKRILIGGKQILYFVSLAEEELVQMDWHSGTQSLKERMMDKCLAAQTGGSVWASSLIHLTMTTNTITPTSWLSWMTVLGCLTIKMTVQHSSWRAVCETSETNHFQPEQRLNTTRIRWRFYSTVGWQTVNKTLKCVCVLRMWFYQSSVTSDCQQLQEAWQMTTTCYIFWQLVCTHLVKPHYLAEAFLCQKRSSANCHRSMRITSAS
jgi:hypothetical protein